MPKVKERQTSFAGGEFAPGLQGRTDLAKYPVGIAESTNFFVNPLGGAMNRSGTLLAAKATTASSVRLIPFSLPDNTVCIMMLLGHAERVDFSFRLWVEGRMSQSNWTQLGFIDGQTWLTAADLEGLSYAQMGAVMTLTGEGFPPAEVRVTGTTGNYNFTVTMVDFAVSPWHAARCGRPFITDWTVDPPADGTCPAREWSWYITQIIEDSNGRVYETMPYDCGYAATGQVTEAADATHLEVSTVSGGRGGGPTGNYFYLKDQVIYLGDHSADGYWFRCVATYVEKARPAHPPRVGDSRWTAIRANSVSAFSGVQRITEIVLSAKYPVRVSWRSLALAPPTDGGRILAFRVYRGRQGRFGFVGETLDETFVDEGADPDFSYPPPQGTNPFAVLNAIGEVVRVENPRVCTYFEGRRIFASTIQRPGFVTGSEIDNYYNFDEVVPPLESHAFFLELASSKFESIRALVPRTQLIALTDSSEWTLDGGSPGSVMTPTKLGARVLSEHGCGTLRPLTFGDSILFMQRKNTTPRLMVASPEQGRLRTVDIAGMSRHLFDGHRIVDWCFAEDPYKQIWAVRDDGVLLSCAFDPEQEMVAWCKHELAGGDALGVMSVPEGLEDVVYIVVRRTVGSIHTLVIEKMAPRNIATLEDAVFLDSAVKVHAYNTGTTSAFQLTLSGVGGSVPANPGDAVTVTAPSNSSPGAYLFQPGVRVFNQARTEYVDVDIADVNTGNPRIYTGRIRQAMPAGIVGVPTLQWGLRQQPLATLPDFVGLEVYGLVDGCVVGPLRPAGTAGTVECPMGYVVGVFGLLMTADLKKLPSMHDRTRKKIVEAVTVEYESSRGVKVGVDFDHLEELPSRQVSDAFAPLQLTTTQHRVVVPGEYSELGTVVIRQDVPLPVTLLGITSELDVGG